MPADKYFTYAAEVMRLTPAITDEPIVAASNGSASSPADFDMVNWTRSKKALAAPSDAQALMKWKVPDCQGGELLVNEHHTMGVRQLLLNAPWSLGSRCNLPEDAIYPLNLGDETGNARWRQQIHDSLRKADPATGRRVLVHHVVRQRRFSSRECFEPFRREQLDAVQVQRRRLA